MVQRDSKSEQKSPSITIRSKNWFIRKVEKYTETLETFTKQINSYFSPEKVQQIRHIETSLLYLIELKKLFNQHMSSQKPTAQSNGEHKLFRSIGLNPSILQTNYYFGTLETEVKSGTVSIQALFDCVIQGKQATMYLAEPIRKKYPSFCDPVQQLMQLKKSIEEKIDITPIELKPKQFEPSTGFFNKEKALGFQSKHINELIALASLTKAENDTLRSYLALAEKQIYQPKEFTFEDKSKLRELLRTTQHIFETHKSEVLQKKKKVIQQLS